MSFSTRGEFGPRRPYQFSAGAWGAHAGDPCPLADEPRPEDRCAGELAWFGDELSCTECGSLA
jgi:hypothetical protein